MPCRASAARGLRRPVERRFFSRAMSRCSSALFQEVDDSEQGDPDDIDEVPVVRHDDRGGHLLAPEVLDGVRAADHEEERDQAAGRSEEHTSELQSLMRISYAVFCLKKKKNKTTNDT